MKWIQRHIQDHFVKEAAKYNYRSRAAFKLLQIQEKYKLLKAGDEVVDLGAAPGGWSQIASSFGASVLAIDLLEMEKLENVRFIRGNFMEIGKDTFGIASVILSDMAPNLTGISAIDQSCGLELNASVLDFCKDHLKPNGHLAMKIFRSAHLKQLQMSAEKLFRSVTLMKPEASRKESSEIYLIGKFKRF